MPDVFPERKSEGSLMPSSATITIESEGDENYGFIVEMVNDLTRDGLRATLEHEDHWGEEE